MLATEGCAKNNIKERVFETWGALVTRLAKDAKDDRITYVSACVSSTVRRVKLYIWVLEVTFLFLSFHKAKKERKKRDREMLFTHLGAVEPRGHEPSSFFCSMTRTWERQERRERELKTASTCTKLTQLARGSLQHVSEACQEHRKVPGLSR